MAKNGHHTQNEPARTPPPDMRPVTPIDLTAGLAAAVEPATEADKAPHVPTLLYGMCGVAWAMRQAILRLTTCPRDADPPDAVELAAELRSAAELLRGHAVELNDTRPDGLPGERVDQIEGLCAALHLALLECEGSSPCVRSWKAIGCAIQVLHGALTEAAVMISDKELADANARRPEGVAA